MRKIESITDFVQPILGRNGDHELCFVRGMGQNMRIVEEAIYKIETEFRKGSYEGKAGYRRVEGLRTIMGTETAEYVEYYDKWLTSGKRRMQCRTTKGSKELAEGLSTACARVLQLYVSVNPQATESMQRNVIVKWLLWFDDIMQEFMSCYKHQHNIKIIGCNVTKEQEYLFYYLLALIGVDVLLIQNEQMINIKDSLLGLSSQFVIEETGNRREKTFEELSNLASSVVMIEVCDENKKVLGCGSGIMIGRKGYILTNAHVVSRGCIYVVRIEDDSEVYSTDELIKYHTVNDLAIIRIDRTLSPLPVYQGEKKLVRGQKVFAIGSPLGLFNSVSDGIISGFRQLDEVDMIQFTAPISPGSSGGALLNTHGDVIGMSTAEFDSGQNINLAVGYECINAFIRGFTS